MSERLTSGIASHFQEIYSSFTSKIIKWKMLCCNNNQTHRPINVIIATNECFHLTHIEMMAKRPLFGDDYEWIIKINFSFWLNIKSSMGSKNVYHHGSRHFLHSSNEWSKKIRKNKIKGKHVIECSVFSLWFIIYEHWNASPTVDLFIMKCSS